MLFLLTMLASMTFFSGEEQAPRVYTKLEYAADFECTNRTKVVYLDAGHGGELAHGCKGYDGRWEKNANLLLTFDVKAALEARGIEVKLTRDKDINIPLYDRPRAAHAEKAACFVSLHHNAPAADKNPLEIRYRSVYSWNDLGKSLADKIAAAIGGDSLHANFAVTRSPEIPSCLVEADFLTHPEGCAAAFDPEKRRALAEQIAEAIVEWLS